MRRDTYRLVSTVSRGFASASLTIEHVKQLANKGQRARLRWRLGDENMLTVRLHDSSFWYFILLYGPKGSDHQKNPVIKNNIRYIKIPVLAIIILRYVSRESQEFPRESVASCLDVSIWHK